MEYQINNKYLVISQNRIQSRKYRVNKIVIGELVKDTDKCLHFSTDNGVKSIWKHTITRLINITNIVSMNEQFLIDRIERSLV